MVSSRSIRVHENFITQMGEIARPIAEQMKKKYGLKKITLDYPTLSDLIAGKLARKKDFKFRIHRVSRYEGRLVLL